MDSSESEEKEEKDNWSESSKTNEALEKKKWKFMDVVRQMCQIIVKGDEDMTKDLTQLGVKLTP